MDGDRVMDGGRYAFRGTPAPKVIAAGRSDDILMEDRATRRASYRERQRCSRQARVVAVGDRDASVVVEVEVPQADAQNGRLELVQSTVDPDSIADLTIAP